MQHLIALENEFEHCFLELFGDKLDLVRYLFILTAEKIPDEHQGEFLKIKTNLNANISLIKTI